MSDDNYMKLAIEQAELSASEGNWPIGCVIVLGGEVIATGRNKVYSTTNRVAHAELSALQDAHDILFKSPNKATLYTTFGPCPMCLGACLNSRLKRVVYAPDLNDSGAMAMIDHLPSLYSGPEYQTVFSRGVLEKECEAIYRKGESTVLEARRRSAE